MSRQEDILYDFLESDKIWPPGIAPTNFVEALTEVLTRIPADAYDAVSESVLFVVQDLRFTAVNVPFNRTYPPCSTNYEIRFDTIVIFQQALAYPHAALVGLLAHELAHTFVSERDHTTNEQETDTLALRWGFGRELEALRAECLKTTQG